MLSLYWQPEKPLNVAIIGAILQLVGAVVDRLIAAFSNMHDAQNPLISSVRLVPVDCVGLFAHHFPDVFQPSMAAGH